MLKDLEAQLQEHLIVVCDVSKLTNEEYALKRKETFGASDASVLCDVNLYKTREELITEKRNKFLTDEEKAIGDKPAVKKGRDLEPLILHKFTEATGIELIKPTLMFKHPEFDYLSTNFDGVGIESTIIPVEAKLVTQWGEKYYDTTGEHEKPYTVERSVAIRDVQAYIKQAAERAGVPPYYYTQVQQQIFFLDKPGFKCPYGYLAVLLDKNWIFKYYYIPRDEVVISHIISTGAKEIEKIR